MNRSTSGDEQEHTRVGEQEHIMGEQEHIRRVGRSTETWEKSTQRQQGATQGPVFSAEILTPVDMTGRPVGQALPCPAQV